MIFLNLSSVSILVGIKNVRSIIVGFYPQESSQQSNLQEEDPWLKSKFAEAPTNEADAPPSNPETKEI